MENSGLYTSNMQSLAAIDAIVVIDMLHSEFMPEGLVVNDGLLHVVAIVAIKDHLISQLGSTSLSN